MQLIQDTLNEVEIHNCDLSQLIIVIKTLAQLTVFFFTQNNIHILNNSL